MERSHLTISTKQSGVRWSTLAVVLSDALAMYVTSGKGNISQDTHIDVHRFVRWYGMNRPVEALTPSDVAQYAESISSSGGDVRTRLINVRDFLTYLKKQKLTDTLLTTHVKLPRIKAYSGNRPVGDQPLLLTKEGYDALETEIGQLKSQRGHISEEIRRAAADKDFKENAPLDAAREQQGHIESRIRNLEQRLRRASVIDSGKEAVKQIEIGHHVTLRDASTGKEVAYTLVDPSEANPTMGRLSIASPVGKAMLGHRAGTHITVTVPRGDLEYHIVSVNG